MSQAIERRHEIHNALRHLQHQLRTPLGHILGYAEMLQEELSEHREQRWLPDVERIHAAALRLLDLVDRNLGDPADVPIASVEDTSAASSPPELTLPGVATIQRDTDRGGRILVVDDEPMNRDLLRRQLEGHGHAVSLAADGRRALEAVWAGGVDLVVLDVVMPEIDGLGVLRSIRDFKSPVELPVIMATALDRSPDLVRAFELGANDYVTKPIDLPSTLSRIDTQLRLKRASDEVAALAIRLELHTRFIRQVFGRYLSDDVVSQLLDREDGLTLHGERRVLSVLMADLRGFSELTEHLGPRMTVALLNNYLGVMADTIEEHGGVVDAFLGDGILALFGAVQPQHDHAERSIACAISMQLAMPRVNDANRASGLPQVEMGIGIASGEAVVGNVGSERRTKYGAVGSAVNLAARIESFSTGGEVWIAPTTAELALGAIDAGRRRVVRPKGFEAALEITQVVGLRAAARSLTLPQNAAPRIALAQPLRIQLCLLEGKDIQSEPHLAEIRELSARAAVLLTDRLVPEMSDLRLDFEDPSVPGAPCHCYAKVVEVDEFKHTLTVRFTSSAEALLSFVR